MSRLALLVMMLILVGCSNEPMAGQAVTPQAGSRNPDIITVQPLSVEVLHEDGDLTSDVAELQLFIVITTETGSRHIVVYPSGGADSANYFLARVNEPIDFGLFMPSIDRHSVGDWIGVQFLIVDNDDLDAATETTIRDVTNVLSVPASSLLTAAVAPAPGAESLVRRSIEAGLIRVSAETLTWYQQADVLGEVSLELNAGNDWQIHGPSFLETSNGNVRIEYQVHGETIRATPVPEPAIRAQTRRDLNVDETIALSTLPGQIVFAVNDPFVHESTLHVYHFGHNPTFTSLEGINSIGSPVLSRNRQWIAFSGIAAGESTRRLFTADYPDLSAIVPFTAELTGIQDNPAWRQSNELLYTVLGENATIARRSEVYDGRGSASMDFVWDTTGNIRFPVTHGLDVAYAVCDLGNNCRVEVRRHPQNSIVEIERLLRTNNQNITGLAWSPSGRSLLLAVSTSASQQSLVLVDIANRLPTQLLQMQTISMPRWSPDEEHVIFLGSPVGQANEPQLYVYGFDESSLARVSGVPFDYRNTEVSGIEWTE